MSCARQRNGLYSAFRSLKRPNLGGTRHAMPKSLWASRTIRLHTASWVHGQAGQWSHWPAPSSKRS